MLPLLTLFLYSAGAITLLLVALAISWHRKRELPGPPRVPLLGNLLEFQAGKDYMTDMLLEWHRKYSPDPDNFKPFEISIFNRRMVILTDPKQCSKVMFQRPSGFRRMEPMGEVVSSIGDGVFSAEGDKWKRHRKVVHPAFLQTNVDKMVDPVNTVSRRLVNKWSQEGKKCSEVPIRASLTAAALDVTSLVSFGYDLDSLLHPESTDNQNIAKAFPFVMGRLTAPIPFYWKLYHTQRDKEFLAVLPEIDALLNKIVQERQDAFEKGEPGRDLLRDMIKAGQAEKTNITGSEFVGNMIQFLLAGQDTTASAVTWTLYFLATNPEVYKKAQQCVDKVLKQAHDDISMDDIKNHLGYVQGCINESLRIAPPAPVMFLQANKEITLEDGTHFNADDAVFTYFYAAQMSPKFFPQPEKFMPERWPVAGGDGTLINDAAFNPFGGGARICPGRRLAVAEATSFVSHILRALDFKLAPGQEKPRMKFEFAVQPSPDPLLVFTPRS